MRHALCLIVSPLLTLACSGPVHTRGVDGGGPLPVPDATVADPDADAGTDAFVPDDVFTGCAMAGWVPLSMSWADWGYADVGEGGFHLCHPPDWAVAMPYRDEIELMDTRPDGSYIRMTIAGEVRLDHDSALTRLGDDYVDWCSSDRYVAMWTVIDGWPALQRHYDHEAPACGECPPSDAIFSHVDTYIAAGTYLIVLEATMLAPVSPGDLETLLAIGRSTITEHAGTRGDVAAEVSALDAAHAACR